MLDRLNRIASRMLPLRMLFLGLALFGFLALMTSLFAETGHDQGLFTMPAMTLFLWALAVYVFILNFAVIPQREAEEGGLVRRGWRRLQRAWYWLVGLFFLVTTLVLLYVTMRIVTLWLRDFF
ncbi:MAG: hypothetical protein PVF23_04370 [Chromatiales bacterium]